LKLVLFFSLARKTFCSIPYLPARLLEQKMSLEENMLENLQDALSSNIRHSQEPEEVDLSDEERKELEEEADLLAPPTESPRSSSDENGNEADALGESLKDPAIKLSPKLMRMSFSKLSGAQSKAQSQPTSPREGQARSQPGSRPGSRAESQVVGRRASQPLIQSQAVSRRASQPLIQSQAGPRRSSQPGSKPEGPKNGRPASQPIDYPSLIARNSPRSPDTKRPDSGKTISHPSSASSRAPSVISVAPNWLIFNWISPRVEKLSPPSLIFQRLCKIPSPIIEVNFLLLLLLLSTAIFSFSFSFSFSLSTSSDFAALIKVMFLNNFELCVATCKVVPIAQLESLAKHLLRVCEASKVSLNFLEVMIKNEIESTRIPFHSNFEIAPEASLNLKLLFRNPHNTIP